MSDDLDVVSLLRLFGPRLRTELSTYAQFMSEGTEKILSVPNKTTSFASHSERFYWAAARMHVHKEPNATLVLRRQLLYPPLETSEMLRTFTANVHGVLIGGLMLLTLFMLLNNVHATLRNGTRYEGYVWKLLLPLLAIIPPCVILVHLMVLPELDLGITAHVGLGIGLALPLLTLGLMWGYPIVTRAIRTPMNYQTRLMPSVHSLSIHSREWILFTGMAVIALVLSVVVLQIRGTSPILAGGHLPDDVVTMIDIVLYVAISEMALLAIGGIALLNYRKNKVQPDQMHPANTVIDLQHIAHAAAGIAALTTGLICVSWVAAVPGTTAGGFPIQMLYIGASSAVILTGLAHLYQSMVHRPVSDEDTTVAPCHAITQLTIYLVMVVTFIHSTGHDEIQRFHWIGLCLLLVAPVASRGLLALRHPSLGLSMPPPMIMHHWVARMLQLWGFCLLLVPSRTDNRWWYVPHAPALAPEIFWVVIPPSVVLALVLVLATLRYTKVALVSGPAASLSVYGQGPGFNATAAAAATTTTTATTVVYTPPSARQERAAMVAAPPPMEGPQPMPNNNMAFDVVAGF